MSLMGSIVVGLGETYIYQNFDYFKNHETSKLVEQIYTSHFMNRLDHMHLIFC